MNEIRVGDCVSVYFENVPNEYFCFVTYIPRNPGEWWQFKTQEGTVFNVLQFSKMVKHKMVIEEVVYEWMPDL